MVQGVLPIGQSPCLGFFCGLTRADLDRSQLAESRLLSKASVVEGIEKLELKPDALAVTILDSAKAWNEFA